jgi:hypothetical protein
MPFATFGIWCAAIGVGQNASIIWSVLRPNRNSPLEFAFPPTLSARIGPDTEDVVPCSTKRNDRILRKVFIRKKSHRQAIAAGYTFSGEHRRFAVEQKLEILREISPA